MTSAVFSLGRGHARAPRPKPVTIAVAFTLAFLGGASPAASAGGVAPLPADAEAWEELAPMLLQIINLSALDPGIAAGLVPEAWVAAAVDGALQVESELPSARADQAPAQTWPIGPWTSSVSLAASIRAVQPGAVVGLYRALRPRLDGECKRREVDAAACERAIKVTASRLSASSVVAQAARPNAQPLTPTQAAVSKLGAPAVDALRTRIRSVGATLWGAPRRSEGQGAESAR